MRPLILLYFGCIGDAGHHLWVSESRQVANITALRRYHPLPGVSEDFLRHIDQTFCPSVSVPDGVYRVSYVPPFRIIAWRDRSVDSRSGSNSALLGVGYETAEELIGEARQQFPSVISRQRQPLRWEGEIHE